MLQMDENSMIGGMLMGAGLREISQVLGLSKSKKSSGMSPDGAQPSATQMSQGNMGDIDKILMLSKLQGSGLPGPAGPMAGTGPGAPMPGPMPQAPSPPMAGPPGMAAPLPQPGAPMPPGPMPGGPPMGGGAPNPMAAALGGAAPSPMGGGLPIQLLGQLLGASGGLV